MKKNILLLLLSLFCLSSFDLFAQTISMRVQQVDYSSTDPDGGGPATAAVTIEFQLMASDPGIFADGMGLSCVYQSSLLMATPTNTTIPVGPLAAALNWVQGVDNRAGNPVAVNYGGQAFDRRMIITFNQSSGIPNIPMPTTWTGFARMTYWTLGNTAPQGGYATPEPGAIVAQNELSSDGGLSTYPYLCPDLNSPIPLGAGVVPVLISSYNVKCLTNGAALSWSTSTETNSKYFEIEKNTAGSWTAIAKVAAAGNSNVTRQYQYIDQDGGPAQYRIKQVDLNGSYIYTDIQTSNCKSSKTDVEVYPVPAYTQLNIIIRNQKSGKTELQLFDLSGRIVKVQTASLFNGTNKIIMDVSGLAGGEYYLRSTGMVQNFNYKVTIAH